MITFCKYLNKDIFNIFVAAYWEGGSNEERLKAMNIDYIVSRGDANKILEYIRKNNIDVIHIHRSGGVVPLETEIIKGAKAFNPNMVIVEKNVFGKFDPICSVDIDCSMFQSMMHLNERYLIKALTPFNFGKMKVFYNMVDGEELEKYRLSSEEIKLYRNKIGASEKDFLLGKIGRPHIAKWSDLILEIMPYLVRLIPNVKLAIMGVPESRSRYISKCKFRNHIIILPETSDEKEVQSFYQAIDVLAHSSKIGECNGNTINEAMYWEKPVVVNSTPRKDNGQLEQVIHMSNGIIANYPQTFARAIAYLYDNPDVRDKMGKNGRLQILKFNNPSLVAAQLEKVLVDTLLSKGIIDMAALKDQYNGIFFHPSENDIVDYRTEYTKRLLWDFGRLSAGEIVANNINFLKRFIWKLKDYLDHKSGFSYGR